MRFDERQHVLIAYFTEYRLCDEHLIKHTGDELDELVGRVPHGKRLVLDFTAVQALTSEMVGVLDVFNKNCKTANVELRCREISPAVMNVLRIAGLDKVFEIAGPTDLG